MWGKLNLPELEALRMVAIERGIPAARAFDFAIEEIRYWKHNHIVYCAPVSVPQELVNLVNALSEASLPPGFHWSSELMRLT